MQLPEELLRMSEVELRKVLTPTNEYKRQYYTDDPTTLHNIYKLRKRYKSIYIFENLNNKELLSYDKDSLYKLCFEHIIKFKKKQNEDFLSTSTNSSFALYIKKLATDIFGEERIDIEFDRYNDGRIDNDSIELTVHYPEVTITNTVELSHVMKDIYIKFIFYIDSRLNKRVVSLGFARTTSTDVEVSKNYQFSHVSSNSIGTWTNDFCFGGVGLASTYNNLTRGNLKGLTSFLFGFEDYLKWESIEGSPYRHLNSLLDKEKYRKYEMSLMESQRKEIYFNVLQKFNDFNYIYNLVEGKNTIKLSQDFVNSIESYLTAKYSEHVYYLINGTSCKLNSGYDSSSYRRDGKESEVFFKGERKKIKIIKTQEDIVIPDKKIHVYILNYVIQELENNLYNYIINKQLELTV